MKGIVFNLLESFVSEAHGESTWDALLAAAGVDGAYTSLGSYPDEDLYRLVGVASSSLGVPTDALIRQFGRWSLGRLAGRYPSFFTVHDSARPFVLTLNDVIHPEVRKIYPGADVPDFEFETPSPESLVMTYRSKRKLCEFAKGLIEGAAEHYGESVEIDEQSCMKRGDDACRLEMRFRRAA